MAAEKNSCGHGGTPSLVWGEDRSRTRPLRVSGVRRPRARALGNLTTVGHLARASLDLSPHVQTRKVCFLTYDGALGAKMSGNESHGRRASF